MARIYQVWTMGEADVRVALVHDRGQADIWVHRVSSWGLAQGDTRWFITRERHDATAWVYFCSIGMAQVKVCFVDSYGEAGWRDPAQARRGLFASRRGFS
ncbi:DUF6150 family protein [Oleiagrimonas soli]|uniref:7(1) septoil knot domain-containing protein n=1 Tax=Oleiagrimonas soli TaxID=1543381 RepID=A0A099CX72_9GAMM|nr:DUF6150 family protein [Oleiagrimonas soli]KGI78281.1 hypothetical protein LF63_0108170 [Oleiagrimonas soli]MBB6183233.1 hypothetical protein [Oleiagrimonas soli]